jgi:hypothetical protein
MKHAAPALLQDGDTTYLVGNILVLRYAENDGAFLSLGFRLPKPARMVSFSNFINIGIGCLLMVASPWKRARAG